MKECSFDQSQEMKLRKLLIALILGISSSVASAEVFNFSYTRNVDNQKLSGQLVGLLQPDGNTVIVSSFLDFASLNSVPGPALPFLYSTDFVNFGTPDVQPKVTFNGVFMDFVVCNVSGCADRSDAFTINAANLSAQEFGSNGAPFYASDGFFGAFGETFSASRWSLSPVPEPMSVALFGLGGLLLFGVVKLRLASRQNVAASDA